MDLIIININIKKKSNKFIKNTNKTEQNGNFIERC